MLTVNRILKKPELGVYLFVALGYYTFSFNGARQAISCAICFWAIRYILDRRPYSYLIAVGAAMLFHETALAALPLYVLASSRFRWPRLAGIAGAASVCAVMFPALVRLATGGIDERFATYSEATEGGGLVMTVFLLAQGLALVALRRLVQNGELFYDRLLNIYLISFIPALVSAAAGLAPSGVLRLHLYYSSSAILLWPLVLMSIRQGGTRNFAVLVFLVVTFTFFVLTTSFFSDLTPYRVNAEFL
jgi:hypothetical protein